MEDKLSLTQPNLQAPEPSQAGKEKWSERRKVRTGLEEWPGRVEGLTYRSTSGEECRRQGKDGKRRSRGKKKQRLDEKSGGSAHLACDRPSKGQDSQPGAFQAQKASYAVACREVDLGTRE